MKNLKPNLAALAATVLILAGCGGGGSSAPDTTPPTGWSGIKQFGVFDIRTGANSSGAMCTTTDASGNVYVAGYTNGGLDGNSQTGANDLFLTKFASDGTRLYTRQLGVAGASTMVGWGCLATDAGGNVYVVGFTPGSLDGSTATGGTYYAFLARYNSDGTLQAVKMLGATGTHTFANGVAVDGAKVYVAGDTTGGLGGNTRNGSSDAFLAQYDFTDSTTLAAAPVVKQLGVAGASTTAKGVAVNGAKVYVAGDTTGGLGGNTLTGNPDTFVAKYVDGVLQ